MQTSSHPSIAVTVLRSHPKESDFLSLAEHQSVTPETFYGGKPVLHCSFTDASIVATACKIHANQELRQLLGTVSPSSTSIPHADEKVIIEHISGFVTSESLLLWRTKGVSTLETLAIPYHAIALHAIQTAPLDETTEDLNGNGPRRRTVYLQLEPQAFTFQRREEEEDDMLDVDEERDTIELSLIPSGSSSSIAETVTNGDARAVESRQAGASAVEIFEALSRCADLHPDLGALDPAEDGEEEGGMGQHLLSGGGWITSENVHEFEDGPEPSDIAVNVDLEVYEEEEDKPPASARTNSVGEGLGPLGAGAGTTRQRQEEHDDEEGNEETKWRRTG